MRRVLKVATAAIVLYVLKWGFVVMLQPPGTTAHTMKHVPWAAFRVFPLRSIWMTTRSGTLREGEMAPDFLL